MSVAPESQAAADPLLGATIDDRYTIDRVLGQGGMSVVYAGVQRELGSAVAIKVLDGAWAQAPEAVELFLLEARTASSLAHPNIVPVSDLGRLPDGRPYLVMPLVVGSDLATLLMHEGPQPPRRVASLLQGAAAALDFIHGRGLVHRDIKSENLMHVTNPDGSETVLVLDFGIASARMPRAQQAEGDFCGTPEFMPPEALAGESTGQRGDVYALATVAFELLTGCLPFECDDLDELIRRKAQEQPRTLEQASGSPFAAPLEAVIARGLSPSRWGRYGSAGELVRALQAAAPATADPAPKRAPARRRSVRGRTLVGTGAVLGLALPTSSTSPASGVRTRRKTELGAGSLVTLPGQNASAPAVTTPAPPPPAGTGSVPPEPMAPASQSAAPKREQPSKSQAQPKARPAPAQARPMAPAPWRTPVEPAPVATPPEPASAEPPSAAPSGETTAAPESTLAPEALAPLAPAPPAEAAAPAQSPFLVEEEDTTNPPPAREIALGDDGLDSFLPPPRASRRLAYAAAPALLVIALLWWSHKPAASSHSRVDTPPPAAPAATATAATAIAQPASPPPEPVAPTQLTNAAPLPELLDAPKPPPEESPGASLERAEPTATRKHERAPASRAPRREREPEPPVVSIRPSHADATARSTPPPPKASPKAASNDAQPRASTGASASSLTRDATDAMLRGASQAAASAYDQALAADPSYAPAWRGKGLLLERTGRSREAAAAFREFLRLQPSGAAAEAIRKHLEALAP
jgi:serine/threonine protein kinase